MATFIPQNQSAAQTSIPPTSRPVQVRTVFVPPPMKMKSPAPGPISPSSINSTGHKVSSSSVSSNGPKVINSFKLNVPGSIPLTTGISITPVSKSNGTGNNSASDKIANGKQMNGKIAYGSMTNGKIAKWQTGKFQHGKLAKWHEVKNVFRNSVSILCLFFQHQ